MAIEEALNSILEDSGAVNAIVGEEIYPVFIPDDGSVPAVTYQQISGVRDQTLSGPSGCVECRFQINCWAKSYKEADQLAEAVRGALDGYSGTKQDVIIQVIHLIDEADLPVIAADNAELNRHCKRLDFQIWHYE